MAQAKLADWSLLSSPDWIGPSPSLSEAAAAAAPTAIHSQGPRGACAGSSAVGGSATDADATSADVESAGGAKPRLAALCSAAPPSCAAECAVDSPTPARLLSSSPSILRRLVGGSGAHGSDTTQSALDAPRALPTATLEVGPSGPVVRWGALDKVPVRTKDSKILPRVVRAMYL